MGINNLNNQFRGLGEILQVGIPFVPPPVVFQNVSDSIEVNDFFKMLVNTPLLTDADGNNYAARLEDADVHWALGNKTGISEAFLAKLQDAKRLNKIQLVELIFQNKGLSEQELNAKFFPSPTTISAPIATIAPPVFIIPAKPLPLPKTEDKPSNTLLYVGIGTGVLALCGGAYWYFSK